MDFKEPSSLLLKIKNTLDSAILFRVNLTKIIYEITGVRVKSQELTFKKGEVFIKASPLKKSQIFLHKKSLLKEIVSVSDGKFVNVR